MMRCRLTEKVEPLGPLPTSLTISKLSMAMVRRMTPTWRRRRGFEGVGVGAYKGV
jgi:hypothetical protein